MRVLTILALLFIVHTGLAQTSPAKNSTKELKRQVEIKATENINIENIENEIWGNNLGDGDSTKLVGQIGLQKFLLINGKQKKEDLPKCIQQFLKDKTLNPFSNFTINVIAEYEHDFMGESEWKCILEVSSKENEKVKGDCKIKKTFYIAIPRNDLQPYIHLETELKSGGQLYI